MHIGVLTHNYPRFPGDFSGAFIEALCQEFAHQEQRVTVWAPFDPAYQKTEDRRQKTLDLRLYRYAFSDEAHTLGYMRTMQSDLALRRNSYWLGPAMMAAGIATITRQARQARPDLLHAHWLLPNGLIGAVVSRSLGIPLVISVPGSDAQVANANPLFRTLARFAMRQASLMTANSADLRDAVVILEPTVLTKFDLILYGADPNVLKPDATGVADLRAQWLADYHPITQSPCHPVIILCVGRMVYKKGFDTLIRALAEPALREQEVLAVLVGEGDQKVEWQTLAHDLGVSDRLRWVGNVPKDKISVYYNACDVLVNPSVRKPVDGLNVCVLDAMSCGKAVIGSTVAGNPLAIVDDETGFLTAEGDPTALAVALAKVAADPALRQRMGAAARQRIETELGWPPLVRRYLAHFQRL